LNHFDFSLYHETPRVQSAPFGTDLVGHIPGLRTGCGARGSGEFSADAGGSAALMHVLAVIPARGGSKSIPLKNIRPLNGTPLLAFTIQAAKRSAYLDRCVVSTDHPDIARVARDYGAEVIERPADLATDQAPTEWALLHALEVLAKDGYRPEYVVTLEPTSPLRTTELIDRCIAEAIRHPEWIV
jgi:CMP-2-keto-3-deoxyoctulosonic acid synthetase